MTLAEELAEATVDDLRDRGDAIRKSGISTR